jgi:nitrate reductase NapE component
VIIPVRISERWLVSMAGLKPAGRRDYSLQGSATDRTFNAVGALATIAFAFNTGILPEMQVNTMSTLSWQNVTTLESDDARDELCGLWLLQATVKQPSTRNIRKALGLQFTVGTFPILVLTFVGYWAYGNAVSPYMLNSVSGPKSAVTVANAAAFLQAIISLHVSYNNRVNSEETAPIPVKCTTWPDPVLVDW